MNNRKILDAVTDFVKSSLKDHDSGHDWWHIDRVRRLALILHKAEGAGDRHVVEIAALLHDIDDRKFAERDDSVTEKKLKTLLSGLGLSAGDINNIVEINRKISFSSGIYKGIPTEEFKIDLMPLGL